MLRFGLIGCGTHARWAVIPALTTSPHSHLVAMADNNPVMFEELKDVKATRYADYQAMLADERLDAVYVCTPCEVHCPATVAALNAGCHVLCEKPMGMNADECRAMLLAAEKAHRVLAIDFEVRQSPGWQRVREWIAAGHLGAVRAIHIDHLWNGHKVFGWVGERRKRFLERTGCLDCGIHMLDLCRFIVGGGEWRDVRGLGAWCGENVLYAPHLAVQARLTPWTVVTLNASFAYTAYIKASAQVENVTIVGEQGVVTLEHENGAPVFKLVSDTLSATQPLQEEGHAETIPHVLACFDAAVAGQAWSPELANGHDGLQAQLAVDEANRTSLQYGDRCPT